MNSEICKEKKLYIRCMMYGDLIKKYIQEELDILNEFLTLEQTIRVINKALELDDITELDINHLIFEELKR